MLSIVFGAGREIRSATCLLFRFTSLTNENNQFSLFTSLRLLLKVISNTYDSEVHFAVLLR